MCSDPNGKSRIADVYNYTQLLRPLIIAEADAPYMNINR